MRHKSISDRRRFFVFFFARGMVREGNDAREMTSEHFGILIEYRIGYEWAVIMNFSILILRYI